MLRFPYVPQITVIQTLYQQGWRGSRGKVLVTQGEDLSSVSISYIRSQTWWHRLAIPALGGRISRVPGAFWSTLA